MNVPKLRFKEFNNLWQNEKLEDAVDFLDEKRKPIKDSDRNNIKGEYPYYGASGIIDYINDYIFDEDLLLLGEDGANILSRSTKLVFKATGKYWVNNHAHVLKPKENYNIDFLESYLENINYESYNTGTAQPKLNQEVCKKINIKIPSLKEQEKIGKTLSLLDKKIELQSKKIEDLKLFTKNTISNELNNLQNYNIFKFKDICNIQTGKSNTQDKCDDGIYPFYIRSENIERSNNYIFDCEAVLTIGDGNIGKVFFYENGKFDCHQRVYVLNNFKNVLGKYVYYYFSAFFYKRAMSMSAKNTVDSVRMEMISDMIIKVPQEKEQIKMINLFSSLDKKLGLEQNKLDKLQELKKGLMQNMFV